MVMRYTLRLPDGISARWASPTVDVVLSSIAEYQGAGGRYSGCPDGARASFVCAATVEAGGDEEAEDYARDLLRRTTGAWEDRATGHVLLPGWPGDVYLRMRLPQTAWTRWLKGEVGPADLAAVELAAVGYLDGSGEVSEVALDPATHPALDPDAPGFDEEWICQVHSRWGCDLDHEGIVEVEQFPPTVTLGE
jgi:hypothetical protein